MINLTQLKVHLLASASVATPHAKRGIPHIIVIVLLLLVIIDSQAILDREGSKQGCDLATRLAGEFEISLPNPAGARAPVPACPTKE